MNEEETSSSMTTCSMRSAVAAIYAGPNGSRITGLRCSRITGLRCSRITGLRCSRITGLRCSRIDERVLGISLDELAAGLHVLTHQHAEHAVGGGRVLQRHLL